MIVFLPCDWVKWARPEWASARASRVGRRVPLLRHPGPRHSLESVDVGCMLQRLRLLQAPLPCRLCTTFDPDQPVVHAFAGSGRDLDDLDRWMDPARVRHAALDIEAQ